MRAAVWVRGVALALATMMVMAGCSGSSEEAEPPETTEPVEVEVENEPTDEVVGEETGHRFVQDLWVYERVSTIDTDGEEIDLTDAVVDGLDGPADREVELTDGVVFYVHESLAAKVTDSYGAERDDLDVVAGLIEYEGDRALSVLATPGPDALASVRFGDQVVVDLTYLEDLIQPGDPLVYDFGFLQAYPDEDGDSDADLTGLELLVARMANEQVGYYGEVVDGEPEVLLYTAQLGEAVAGSIHSYSPGKAQDMRDGMNKGLQRCRGGVSCVSRFFRKFGEGAESSWNQAWGNGGGGPGSGGSRRHPVCRGSNCARSWGEPHLTTFDGYAYDMQAVGEFIAMTSPEIEVQLRTRPYLGFDTISIGTAVAVGLDDHRITVDIEAERDEIVRIDGQPIGLDDLRLEPQTVGEAQVTLVGDALQVERGLDLITIANLEDRGFIDLYLDFAAERVDTQGLLGSANGDPSDDFTTRDGEVLDQPLSHDDLYGRFVESWRISDDESLFDYAAGTDTEHFTDRSRPVASVTLDDLDAGARKRGEAVCRAAGIDNEAVFESCVFDYALTGDVSFVRAAATAEVAQLIVDGDLDPAAMPIGGDGERPRVPDLVAAPYEPGPNEIAWLFTTDDGAPEQVPSGLQASPVRDANDFLIFELTDQYPYLTDSILRIGSILHAFTPEDAVELDSYVDFEITPTAGPVEITGVQIGAARGRAGDTRRGIDLRSSVDGYSSSLLVADIEVTRGDMEHLSAVVKGLRISEPTTFRLYVYTGSTTATVEIGYLALTTRR